MTMIAHHLIVLLCLCVTAWGNVHLVVPSYNEEHRLPVDAFVKYASTHPKVHFVFVDDGSTDNTKTMIYERLVKASPHPGQMELLALDKNQGKAEAVRLGMLHVIHANPSEDEDHVVGFWDADLATPLEEVDGFLDVFRDHSSVEMVFGARVALLGRKIQRYASRHYLGRVFATLTSVVLNLRIYDTQCGAKLFRLSKDLELVLREPFHSKWIFDVEILARFLVLFRGGHGSEKRRAEDAVYEFPLHDWRDIAGSKLNLKDKLSALYELFAIYSEYFAFWSTGSLSKENQEL